MKSLTIRIPRSASLTKDNLACVALFFFLVRRPVVTVLVYLLHTPPAVNEILSMLLMYIPLLLIPFTRGAKRKLGAFILVWLTVLLACMLTFLFHPEYKEWLFFGSYNIWDYIFMPSQYLYMVLFIRMVDDPKRIIKVLKWAGMVLLAYNIYRLYYAEFVRGYWVATGIGKEDGVEGEYNLAFGYDMLFLFVMFTILGAFEKKKWYYLLSVISLGCIVLAGSRGPLLGVGLTLAMVLFDRIRTRPMATRLLLTCSFVLVLGLVIFNISSIMQTMGIILQKMGVSSRTVEILASGEFGDDSGRSVLWGIAVDLIRTGGPFGNGVYGDRYVIAEKTTMWIGYCHNVALEVLVDFGYLLGGAVLLIFVWRIIKNICAAGSEWRTVYLIFLLTASQLILSGSFWYSMPFWGCLAVDICWNCNGSGKKPQSAGRSLRIRLPGKL